MTKALTSPGTTKADGWFMKDPSNEKDIYAISKKDFDATYKKQG